MSRLRRISIYFFARSVSPQFRRRRGDRHDPRESEIKAAPTRRMTRLQFEKTADACHRAPPPLRLFIENVLKTRKVVSLEMGRVINHQAFTLNLHVV
jgi:hypothetical protein